MGVFLEFLRRWNPRTGRLIDENGDLVNEASLLAWATDPSGARRTLEIEHAKIHTGQAYVFDAFVTLSDTTPLYRVFLTGNRVVHFKELEIVAEKNAVVVEIFEGPSYTGGTDATAERVASNRVQTPDPDGLTILSGPTVTADGLRLERFYLPGSETVGGNFGGSSTGTGWELVLKPNTPYLVKGQRIEGTGTCRLKVKYRWYVEGPRADNG